MIQTITALSGAIKTSVTDFKGPYLISEGKKQAESEGFSQAAAAHLKIIVAVNDFRDRNRDGAEEGDENKDEDEAEMINEAIDCKIAMMGIADDAAASAHIEGQTMEALEDEVAVLFTSTTKSTAKEEGDERRLMNLLSAKGIRFEVVYIDIVAERKDCMLGAPDWTPAKSEDGKPGGDGGSDEEEDAAGGLDFGVEVPQSEGRQSNHEIPQLHVAGTRIGGFNRVQALEDDGMLDTILEPCPEGEGFWFMPENWGMDSALVNDGEGHGLRVVNKAYATS